MKQNFLERKITKLIQPVMADKGYELINVTMQGQNLQIMAENAETRRLGVDECAMLSREISTLLEVEDPIKGFYRLEVSSPGIDRPLVRLQDYEYYKDFEAKIEISPPLNGQKRFRGYVRGVDGNEILLDTDHGPVKLPFDAIEKAKLVLTDELIKNSGIKVKDLKEEENEETDD